jgi:hypothetical protein
MKYLLNVFLEAKFNWKQGMSKISKDIAQTPNLSSTLPNE